MVALSLATSFEPFSAVWMELHARARIGWQVKAARHTRPRRATALLPSPTVPSTNAL
jgi:hypothetical protein